MYDEKYADILEYSVGIGKWIRIGEMSGHGSFQAVSIVEYATFKEYCL